MTGTVFPPTAGGMLFLQGSTATFELSERSTIAVRSRTTGTRDTEAELSQGTLIFRADVPTGLEVVVRDARIRPASKVRTVGQVSVIEPNELRLYARRGSLELLYGGEEATIAEGEAYRVILDPSDEDANRKGAVKAARTRKTFLMVAITGGVAGAAAAAALNENHGHKKMESPDRP